MVGASSGSKEIWIEQSMTEFLSHEDCKSPSMTWISYDVTIYFDDWGLPRLPQPTTKVRSVLEPSQNFTSRMLGLSLGFRFFINAAVVIGFSLICQILLIRVSNDGHLSIYILYRELGSVRMQWLGHEGRRGYKPKRPPQTVAQEGNYE